MDEKKDKDLFGDERITITVHGELHSAFGKFDITRQVTPTTAKRILKMLFVTKEQV